jgi:PadR family transcriptional regulator PadR
VAWALRREFELNTALSILYVLSKGPAHGYEIMKRVREEFCFPKSPGVLYPTLRKMLSLGYVEVVEEVRRGGRHLKVYRITEAGSRALSEYMDRVEQLKRVAKGFKMFDEVGGGRLREAIFRVVEVLPSARREDVEELRNAISNFVGFLEGFIKRVLSRG